MLAGGMIERIGLLDSSCPDHHTALQQIVKILTEGDKAVIKDLSEISAVGHRVVHGGEKFKSSVLINDEVLEAIRSVQDLAPLHNPPNIAGIESAKAVMPDIPHIAVFDTAFHQSLPEKAFIYGLSYSFYRKDKIRRYGFHGTSHEYAAGEAAKRLGKPFSRINLITCHLGNGCSITAIRNGKSVDTSMGFTPLEGLLMGSRCGDIDPAVITYLIEKKKMPAGDVDRLLNQESGLKGISGISNDMRKILQSADMGNQRCKLAIEMFVYRIRKYISAYLGILGKTDAVVFTAGISENQPRIVKGITDGLFDNLKSKPKIMVIPTDEELMIARQTYQLLKRA